MFYMFYIRVWIGNIFHNVKESLEKELEKI